jgi:hypothetical protein
MEKRDATQEEIGEAGARMANARDCRRLETMQTFCRTGSACNDLLSFRQWPGLKFDVKNDASSHCGFSNHVEELLNRCFPSRLLHEREIPSRMIKLDSSYNFWAILMPQRRYFSFRREGLLFSRLCDQESAATDPSEVHWTLNFTNSSFTGEFPESLVQALYMCPTICGLSLVGNNGGSGEGELGMERTSSMKSNAADEGGGLLANMVGSLPPWIANVTFERVLDD